MQRIQFTVALLQYLRTLSVVLVLVTTTTEVVAQAVETGPDCKQVESGVVCEGTFDTALTSAYRKSLEDALTAAETIEPAKIPAAPVHLCQTGMPVTNAATILEKIRAHHKKREPDTPLTPLTFRNLRIDGALKLTHGLKGELRFDDVLFCNDVTLDGTFERIVVLNNTILMNTQGPGRLKAAQAVFKQGLDLKELIAGEIDLHQADVSRELDLKYARFGHLQLARARVDNLLFPHAAQLAGLHDQLRASLQNRDDVKIPGSTVELSSAQISQWLFGDWSRVEGGISGARAQAEVLRIQEARIARADFRKIHVGEITLKGSHLGRPNDMALPPCGEASVLIRKPDILSFEEAHVSGDFALSTRVRRSQGGSQKRLDTKVYQRLCLNGLQVDGRLELEGLIAQQLDLNGARAGRILRLASNTLGPLTWHDPQTASLNLSQVHLARIAVSNSFQMPAEFSLSGANIAAIEDVSATFAMPNSYKTLEHLIAKFEDPAVRVPAYRVLENTLSKLGDTEGAKAISFNRLRSQTDAMCWFCGPGAFLQKLLARASEWLGGYGLKPERTLICATLLIFAGALIAGSRDESRALVASRIGGFYGLRGRRFETLLLSLDRLIPLVSLDKQYSEKVFSDRFLRVYFTFHALMGVLLAGTVVAYVGRSIGFSS